MGCCARQGMAVLQSFKQLLNHHVLQNIAQIVIPVIHYRHIPGEKPVNLDGAVFRPFFGHHHHHFVVYKCLFFLVQVFKVFPAGNEQDQNRQIHTRAFPANCGDTGINALTDLNSDAGQPLLNLVQKNPSLGS
jgi:hypothetical protein